MLTTIAALSACQQKEEAKPISITCADSAKMMYETLKHQEQIDRRARSLLSKTRFGADWSFFKTPECTLIVFQPESVGEGFSERGWIIDLNEKEPEFDVPSEDIRIVLVQKYWCLLHLLEKPPAEASEEWSKCK